MPWKYSTLIAQNINKNKHILTNFFFYWNASKKYSDANQANVRILINKKVINYKVNNSFEKNHISFKNSYFSYISYKNILNKFI